MAVSNISAEQGAQTTADSKSRYSDNPFLRDNFAPVAQENEIFSAALRVTGAIPKELNGQLLRIGPNPVTAPKANKYHWFTGTGMVHGIKLQNGQAQWYKNKFVVSDDDARALKKTKLSAPRKSSTYGVNTNVLRIAGNTFAVVEAGALPIKLSADLESLAYSDFDGTLKGGFSAHPRLDPITGEYHVLAYNAFSPIVDYLVIDKNGRSRTAAQIAAPHKPMIHDTAITKSFVVVLDLPVTFNLLQAFSGTFPYTWNRRQSPRLGLLPRNLEGSAAVEKTCWFDAPFCYAYHILNAYELGDKVIVDVVKNSLSFDAKYLTRNNRAPHLVRWTIDLVTNKLSESALSDYSVEFPRLNDHYVGREYRYGYTAMMTENLELGAAYKHDLLTGNTTVHDYGHGRSTMEPIFIPRQATNETEAAEDDGWIISFVYDTKTDSSDIVILDAQDFGGKPLATIHLPVRVPYGFHGNWLPDPIN